MLNLYIENTIRKSRKYSMQWPSAAVASQYPNLKDFRQSVFSVDVSINGNACKTLNNNKNERGVPLQDGNWI